MRPRGNNKRQEPRAQINELIEASEVRLIDQDGNQVGVVPIDEALAAAQEAGLDLVPISNSDPMVCKIMDYGKKLYEEKKTKNLNKKKQVQVQIKEMKFRPNTDIGDYNVKMRNITRFLEHGDKVKVTLRFRGREMAHQELGLQLMERIEADLAEMATVELRPKMEGRQMTMVLAPSNKKK